MTFDEGKIDQAVLALLYLGLHDGSRAWKGFDWDAMNRLYEKGFISDPRSKAKSVVFSEDVLDEAQRCLEQLFADSVCGSWLLARIGRARRTRQCGPGIFESST